MCVLRKTSDCEDGFDLAIMGRSNQHDRNLEPQLLSIAAALFFVLDWFPAISVDQSIA